MSQLRSTALLFYKMESQKSLTLRRGSFLAHSRNVVAALLPRRTADIPIMCKYRRTALGCSKMHGQISLTLHWHSFFGWGNKCIVCLFGYHADQHIHFARTRQWSLLIVKCGRLNIIDTRLTLKFKISKQSWYTQLVYATNWIFSIDIHNCVSKYYNLYPEA